MKIRHDLFAWTLVVTLASAATFWIATSIGVVTEESLDTVSEDELGLDLLDVFLTCDDEDARETLNPAERDAFDHTCLLARAEFQRQYEEANRERAERVLKYGAEKMVSP